MDVGKFTTDYYIRIKPFYKVIKQSHIKLKRVIKSEKDTTRKKDEPLQAEPFTEGEQKLIEQRVKQPDMTTMMTETTGNIALRTIPVYIKNGNRKLQVNALLDDALQQALKPINVDAAAELGLNGLDWDDPLPKDISTKIVLWFAELVLLSEIKVSRCLQLQEQVVAINLPVFLLILPRMLMEL